MHSLVDKLKPATKADKGVEVRIKLFFISALDGGASVNSTSRPHFQQRKISSVEDRVGVWVGLREGLDVSDNRKNLLFVLGIELGGQTAILWY